MRRRISLGLVVLVLLVCTLPARAQELAAEALQDFPADTQQLVYTSLEQLRYSPEYPQIRRRMLKGQLFAFANFLRALGVDPENSVDEVILGWRGPAADSFFGLARGSFPPDLIRQEFATRQLPTRNYLGNKLYVFGTGADSRDLFFTFFDSSLAAFGRWADVRALLSVRQGDVPSLETKPSFVSWEREEEGTAPQWGVLTGRSAANLAAGWLAAGKGRKQDLSPFLGPVEAVLYSVTWDEGFDSELSIICQSQESASALLTLLKLWQDAPTQSALASLLPNMQAHRDGSRVLISLSGPVGALDSVLGP